ncbi:very short patch repair endonuclease [Marinococcus luteus]|uniref:very short patch repair endonuclease n=1 Tax=Marinococcus luteus TaxID=1122204 RepID=UPI002ACD06A6|nr:very short patch repair endonuclease [Marinococcus luteus]MDZ5781893.1 very short patch repair endonuclease [Marinococcus luteus]
MEFNTSDQRSKIMKSIKSQSQLENVVTKELWKRGWRFRKNTKMFGKPDISIKKYKVVIFIDSCFWHFCPIHGRYPKKNLEYWVPKLDKNIKRDKEVTDHYVENGWNILRIWEHEVKDDFHNTLNKIENHIIEAKKLFKH